MKMIYESICNNRLTGFICPFTVKYHFLKGERADKFSSILLHSFAVSLKRGYQYATLVGLHA